MRLLIRIRNELTAHQRKLATKIKPDLRSKGLQQRLQSKLARIEKEVQRRIAAGQPPIDAIKLMQSFKMKMESGQPQAAEVVLDRVMKILGLGKTDSSTKNKKEK